MIAFQTLRQEYFQIEAIRIFNLAISANPAVASLLLAWILIEFLGLSLFHQVLPTIDQELCWKGHSFSCSSLTAAASSKSDRHRYQYLQSRGLACRHHCTAARDCL